MGQSPQEILVFTVLLAGLGAMIIAGMCRRLRMGGTDLLFSAAFLAAYYLAYGKVPAFPPVGAVNKIFYISVIGAGLGICAGIVDRPGISRALILLQPILAAVYIGQTRLTQSPFEIAVAAGWGVAVMALMAGQGGKGAGEPGLRRAIALSVFCLGFAPIALLGASSSSLQLALIFAVMLGGVLIWSVFDDDFALGPPALLGGVGGMISVGLTVALITRKIDLAALALLSAAFLLPLAADLVPDNWQPRHRILRLSLFALLCLAVATAGVLVAVQRYGAPFPI